MTLIICESLREIGEMACVTSARSSREQTLNNYELKTKINQKYDNTKKAKIEGRNQDYLQDLYGTSELTTTEYNQKLQRYKNGILNEKSRLNKVT